MPHTPSHPAYTRLTSTFSRLHRLGHLASLAHWDQAAMMPPKGNDARGAALAELDVLMHGMMTAPELAGLLAEADTESVGEFERANLSEMRRAWERANALPASLVEAQALAHSRCEHAWRSQRPANDWAGFRENLREVVRLSREEGQRLAGLGGGSVYEALMNKYEPGMRCDRLDAVFGAMRDWLPDLIARIRDKQAGETVVAAQGPFPIETQRALGLDVMALLGFDFAAGRLDVSNHPFCGGVPEDVRITTRYEEGDFLQSLLGIIHETGHARYEQNLPREWLGQPVGLARSMGIHESQSLSFEMQLGRSPGFLTLLAPRLRARFGDQPAFETENLIRLCTRVEPGFIRVDADEASYPAHVILRYEIERALMEGDIEVDDIPALWDEKMSRYLGVDTRGNYRNGCMQDIHWTTGGFGYFPSYTLGALYAAQYFATLRRTTPDLDQRIANGELSVVFDWLKDAIWSQASRWSTAELVGRATGEDLDPRHFRAHLEARYLGGVA